MPGRILGPGCQGGFPAPVAWVDSKAQLPGKIPGPIAWEDSRARLDGFPSSLARPIIASEDNRGPSCLGGLPGLVAKEYSRTQLPGRILRPTCLRGLPDPVAKKGFPAPVAREDSHIQLPGRIPGPHGRFPGLTCLGRFPEKNVLEDSCASFL